MSLAAQLMVSYPLRNVMTSQLYFIYSTLTVINRHTAPKLADNYASGTEDKLFYSIQ